MAEECTTWTTLRCPDCDSARFVQTFGLATRANGGTVPTPHGWECCGCRNTVDLGVMSAAASVRQLEQEIAERQAAIAARRPLPPPSPTCAS
jgi:hypothetical protein